MLPAALAVRAYPAWLRVCAAGLQAVAALNLVELAVRLGADLVAPAEVERVPLPMLVRRLFFFTVLPGLLFLLARALAASSVAIDHARLTVTTGGSIVELPLASIASLRPWRLPLPGPGFDLLLRSGNRLEYGFSLPDPAPLALRLARAAGISEDAAFHPTFRDASARQRMRWLHHPALKLGLVPAAVTFILFRLHQLITYGGLFGEYHSFGARRWLRTLSGVALEVFGHLLVYAAAWRAAVELIAQPAARLPERPARRIRLVLEVAAALGYYGGIAALLYHRLLAS